MKISVRALAVMMVGAGLVLSGVTPALSDDEFCPMGGTMVKVEVDQTKVADWVARARKKFILVEDPWTLITLSDSSHDIALRFTSDSIFFGVAGKNEREVDAKSAERTFGNGFKTLREAVQKTMGDLWKLNAVKIDGGDVQALAEAAGLGVLEKSGRAWELKTQDCEGKSLDTSDLK